MGRNQAGPAAPQLVVQPFLDLNSPTTGAALDAAIERNTFAYAVLSPLHVLYQRIAGATDERTRETDVHTFLQRFFGEANARRRMRDALRKTKTILIDGLEPYVPDADYRARLDLVDDHAEDSLEELLAHMFPRGNGKDARRRAFIARRRYYLMRYLLHLDRSEAAIVRGEQAATRVGELLNAQFLLADTGGPQVLQTHHDPENDMRCLDARIGGDPWEHGRTTRVRIRMFRDLAGKERPVIVQLRVKDAFSTLIRMFRDGIAYPEYVPDRLGIRFVCFSHDDRRALLAALFERFPIIWSTADDWVDLYAGTAVRRLNRFASRYFRVLKFSAEFEGTLWEFQIMHAKDFVNLWYSNGEENWYRYRLRQLFALFLPQFFPRRIYDVRWGRDHVRAAFTQWALREPRKFPLL